MTVDYRNHLPALEEKRKGVLVHMRMIEGFGEAASEGGAGRWGGGLEDSISSAWPPSSSWEAEKKLSFITFINLFLPGWGREG